MFDTAWSAHGRVLGLGPVGKVRRISFIAAICERSQCSRICDSSSALFRRPRSFLLKLEFALMPRPCAPSSRSIHGGSRASACLYRPRSHLTNSYARSSASSPLA